MSAEQDSEIAGLVMTPIDYRRLYENQLAINQELAASVEKLSAQIDRIIGLERAMHEAYQAIFDEDRRGEPGAAKNKGARGK